MTLVYISDLSTSDALVLEARFQNDSNSGCDRGFKFSMKVQALCKFSVQYQKVTSLQSLTMSAKGLPLYR